MTTTIEMFKWTKPHMARTKRVITDPHIYEALARAIALEIMDYCIEEEQRITLETFEVNGFCFSIDVAFNCYWCSDYITDEYGSSYDFGEWNFRSIDEIDVWFCGKLIDPEAEEYDEYYLLDEDLLQRMIEKRL